MIGAWRLVTRLAVIGFFCRSFVASWKMFCVSNGVQLVCSAFILVVIMVDISVSRWGELGEAVIW